MVDFDAVGTGSGYPQNIQNISHSLGIASGNDRIVLGVVESIGPAPHTFNVFTYNGVAMTQLAQVTASIFGRIIAITVFYLLDANLPASAGTYTFSYRTINAYGSYAAALSYYNASQSAPGTASGFGSNNPPLSGAYTTNITPSSGNGMLVDFGALDVTASGSGTPGTGQTERADIGSASERLLISEKPFSDNSANSMSYTPTMTYYAYAHLIAEIAGLGGGPVAENAVFFGTNF
jgi:hypothetical protein